MRISERLNRIPPYLFAEIDRKKAEAIKKGVDVISLGIGDPDLPTPDYIIESLYRGAKNPENHRYPSYEGSLRFREAVAHWYKKRYDVDLDPETEIMALIGSKEGIAHVFFAFVDPGDYTLIPDPAYPVYKTATIFAGGTPVAMPLKAENNFLPDLEGIPQDVVQKAKLMFLNYPNNPTAATADLEFFSRAVEFARKHELIICHDSAYMEITFDGYKAPSLMQVPGGKEVGIEFGSLSKPFNMTGWRIGYAVGSKEIISKLAVIKTNIDSGQFNAIQEAAVTALEGPDSHIHEMNRIYKERRDVAIRHLKELGIQVRPSNATFYIWAPVPEGYTSTEFAATLLEKAGVIVSPGNAYGDEGEGYFRIALTVDKQRITEAFERIKEKVEF